MSFAFWLIVIIGLMITGVVGKEALLLRQKLEEAEDQESDSLLETSANETVSRMTQLKDRVARQVLGAAQNLNGSEPQPANSEPTGLSAMTTRLTQQVTSKVQEFREETDGGDVDTVDTFRSWIDSAFDENPEIRQWLGSLSDEQLEAYTSYLADFCQDMGFELEWLFDANIAREPELAKALEKIVLQYSQASYQAVSTQQEIMAFKALSDYLQNPVSRQNLPLSQKVFGKLIEQGLTPINISDHLSLSNRERKEQITQTIQTIAQEYPESFKSLLAQTMSEPETLSIADGPDSPRESAAKIMASFIVPLVTVLLILSLVILLVEQWDRLQFQILNRLFLITLLIVTVLYFLRFWVITGIDCIPQCASVNLVNRDLRGFPLEGANFSYSNLNGARFDHTNLRGANFIAASLLNADLKNVDLTDAKMMGAKLDGANLSGAILTNLDLSGASLVGADLTGLDLTSTKVQGADFSEAELEGADFSRVNLNSVLLMRATLNGAIMRGVDLRGASLAGADLSGVHMSGSNLSGAWMNLATLIGAEMIDVDLTGADLIGATLTSADLTRSKLIGTHLTGANLKGANLNGVDLNNAKVRAADLTDENIKSDPVLAELNSLGLSEIRIDTSIEGVNTDARTVWPDEETAEAQANLIPALDADAMEDAINVGLLYSLSGPMSFSEVAVQEATLLAIDEINEDGGVLGRQIFPIVEDGTSDPQFFQEKARKLLERDEVSVIFGIWTSDSRKAILPVLEELNGLLFYPVQYEGFERSKNIFYFGSDPAQQIIPAVEYLLAEGHEKFLLLGSDSIFSRTINLIIKAQLNQSEAIVAGEAYVPLGEEDFTAITQQLRTSPPDVILNTMYGTSNLAFFQQLREAGFSSFDMTVMAIGVAEEEVRQIGADFMVGHLMISDYYQTYQSSENLAFVTAYKNTYGSDRVTSAPIEAAYTSVYVWKELVEQANSIEVDDIREAAATAEIEYISPSGPIEFDNDTQQIYKMVRIGQIREDGLIEEIEGSAELVQPDAFLESFEWAANMEEMLESFKE